MVLRRDWFDKSVQVIEAYKSKTKGTRKQNEKFRQFDVIFHTINQYGQSFFPRNN